MPVLCKEILELPSLRELKLLGGREGLSRVVTWPFVGQNDTVSGSAYGGELLFFTGVGIKTDSASLKHLLVESEAANLAGVVFMVGSDYIPNIDESISALADSLKFPVFTVPWDSMLVEITRDIANYIVIRQNESKAQRAFLENLLSPSVQESEELIRQSELYGFDCESFYRIAVLKITQEKADDYLPLYTQGLLQHLDRRILSMARENTVVMFLPAKAGEKETASLLDGICASLAARFPDASATAGFGRPCRGVGRYRLSFLEAEQTVHRTAKLERKNVNNLDLGLYRLFLDALEPHELEAYCEGNIGKIVEYDRQNGSELVKTLEVYFESRFNLSKTAKALNIHRNSLMYRLSRIEEITGRELEDPYTLLDIVNSVLIRKMASPQFRAIG